MQFLEIFKIEKVNEGHVKPRRFQYSCVRKGLNNQVQLNFLPHSTAKFDFLSVLAPILDLSLLVDFKKLHFCQCLGPDFSKLD